MSAHKVNFRKTHHLPTDILELTGETIRSYLELENTGLSGIIGGPPCQGFSHIGLRNQHDERNALFVDFFRIVSEMRPSFFLAENVPGIMRPIYTSIRDVALSQVSKEYSVLPPLKITAKDYGAPTARTRIFFFGYLTSKLNQFTVDSFLPSIRHRRGACQRSARWTSNLCESSLAKRE